MKCNTFNGRLLLIEGKMKETKEKKGNEIRM